VILALVRFVKLVSRPRVEVLGSVAELGGLHSIERHPGARTIPGLLVFRFNGPIVFFNAPHFKQQALAAAAAAAPSLRWLVVDMIPVTMIDVTGLYTARDLIDTLRSNGVVFATAGRQTEWQQWLARRQMEGFAGARSFPTLRAALEAYRQETGSTAPAGVTDEP